MLLLSTSTMHQWKVPYSLFDHRLPWQPRFM
ncbi:hypothetical protein ANCCAN_07363 [Ancylostoma caninum]|uniref:Uncharacterized protein n=1 Tax=Ancylostoma caninum TaxID=29170 RepID=A0A368GUH4_ANCCA|nr:hypothetical protein ANCCAN_07363 [Ancylostoma caninum]